MADESPEDTPADSLFDTPTAPQFPGQTYRDRSGSHSSETSDSAPKRPLPRNPNDEPSQSPVDPSAGPIPPFSIDPARLVPNPFPPPPPGPRGVNPFAGLPVPPSSQPGRDPRSKTMQGSFSPPSRPPTRASAAAGGGGGGGGGGNPGAADEAGDAPGKVSAPRRPSTKRTVKQEDSSSARAEARRATQAAAAAPSSTGTVPPPLPPRHRPSADPTPPGPGPSSKHGKKTKGAPTGKRPQPQRQSKKEMKKKVGATTTRAARRGKEAAVVTGPARNTRSQRGGRKVEFGFGDLDVLENRVRRERREERERERRERRKEKGKEREV